MLVNNIVLVECSKLSEAEILLRKIPQDTNANHVPEIVTKINNGIAKIFKIQKNGIEVGFCIYEIYENEFWILAMQATEYIDSFKNIYFQICDFAKILNCKSVCFETIRAGLIEKALQNEFYIWSVKMRKLL